MSPKNGRARGSALIIALIFVALFSVLAVGYLTASNADLRKSQLYLDSRRAHLAAENGLSLARQMLSSTNIQNTTTANDTLVAIAAGLNSSYGSTVLGGNLVTVAVNNALLPAIIFNFPEGPAQCVITVVAQSDSSFTVESCGTYAGSSRTLYNNYVALRDASLLTAYGVASRSKISMTGNAQLVGVNNPLEGSVLSTDNVDLDPLYITGHVFISGNAAISNPLGHVELKGNSQIGGLIQIGVQSPPFPAIDTSVFAPYATNIIGPGSPTSGTFENIRIRANTNPTFNNSTIYGVLYIESPNKVTFTGDVNLVGVIAAQLPSGPLDLNNNTIKFTGNSSVISGVEGLPNSPQFAGLRNLTGSLLLAPGFQTEFTGNFSMNNGSIVSSQLKFTGNASGTIHGSILNYDETQFDISGNSTLRIDHSGSSSTPAGMVFPRVLSYVKGSYEE